MAIRGTALVLVLAAILAGVVPVYAGGNTGWTSTGGPPGASVNALIAPPGVPGALLAGTSGGIYLTRDGGAHWQPSFSGLGDLYISSIASSPDATIIYAGTRNGIFRSKDGGATWSRSDPHLTGLLISSLIVDPRNPRTAYASSASNVFKTENGGDEWSDITPVQPMKVAALALAPDSLALYVAAESGIHATTDRGAHWSVLVNALPDGSSAQSLLVTDKSFLASTASYLYRSKDGKNWTPVSGLNGVMTIRPLAVDPQDSNRVYAGTTRGLAKSLDGGTTWTLLANTPTDPRLVLSIHVGTKGTAFLGTARGVWRTQNDGAAWEALNTGLSGSTINALAHASTNPDTLISATPYGIWCSRDGGKNWVEATATSGLDTLSLVADPTSSQNIYAGTRAGTVLVSKDGGATFSRLASQVGNKAPVASLAVLHAAANSATLYAGTIGEGVFWTSDEGKTWTSQSGGLGTATRVSALGVVSPSMMLGGTNVGLFRLNPSSPNAVWTAASTSLPGDQVNALVIDPSKPKTLYVLYDSSGIFKSDDGGATWNGIGQGAFSGRARPQTLATGPAETNVLYVGTSSGVHRSTDGGNSWTLLSSGLPLGADVSAIAIDPHSPDKVFIGTSAFGVLGSVEFVAEDEMPWFEIATSAGIVIVALVLISLGLSRARRRRRAARGVRSPAPRSKEVKDASESIITNVLWTYGEANADNLAGLARDKLPQLLTRYLEQHPDDSLTLDKSATCLKLDNQALATEFFGDWQVAREAADDPQSFAAITNELADQMCHLLGFARVDERDYRGLIGYVVRAPTLRLKIPSRFPIVFMPPHEVTEEDMASLRDLMGILDLNGYFALLIDLHQSSEGGQQRTLKLLARQAIHDYIVLDREDIHRLFAARDPVRRLIERILEQVDLSVISPYVTSGPVPDNMFFGREHELKTILRTIRSTNYAIMGGRKIGKTSVLRRLHRLLQETSEFLPLYLDCQAVHSDADFFEAAEALWHEPMSSRTPEGFRRMILGLMDRYPNRCLVLLFDEIDFLLKNDVAQGERLFHIFRALSQEKQVRFIFCGEKQLAAAARDPHLVFFNFCTILPLSYLPSAEAQRIVVEPMQDMGITFEAGAGLAAYIVKESAGHPNILQYLCQKLIERINTRQETTITRTDVQAVLASAEYVEYVTAIVWGNADPLERLITCLMLDCRESTAAGIAGTLRKRKVNVTPDQIQIALDDLCLASILRRDGPKYTMANDKFAEALRKSQDIDGLVTSLSRVIPTNTGVVYEER